MKRRGISERSSAAAEKSDEGMAFKIRTKAEDMPDVTEIPVRTESKISFRIGDCYFLGGMEGGPDGKFKINML